MSFASLPPELLLHVAGFLLPATKDIKSLSSTCHRARDTLLQQVFRKIVIRVGHHDAFTATSVFASCTEVASIARHIVVTAEPSQDLPPPVVTTQAILGMLHAASNMRQLSVKHVRITNAFKAYPVLQGRAPDRYVSRSMEHVELHDVELNGEDVELLTGFVGVGGRIDTLTVTDVRPGEGECSRR